MRRGVHGTCAAGLTLAALLASAVVPGRALAQQPASEAPRVRSAAALTLVNVDVVVTRKDGTPVEGLTAEDFAVLHDGRHVAITNFREEKRAAPKAEPAASAAAANSRTASVAPPTAVPPMRARRHLLYFVDDLALPEVRERAEVFGALKEIATRTLEPGDDAMIVTWRRGIRRVWPFTTDLALIERRLDVVARDVGRLGDETRTDLEQLAADDAFYLWAELGDSELSRQRLVHERWLEVKSKLVALRGLVASMAGLEGRKDLILVSRRLSKIAGIEYEGPLIRKDAAAGPPGLFGEVKGINTKEFIDALTETANAVGVTIHSIHAEGWSMDVPTGANALMPDIPDRLFSSMIIRQNPQVWTNEMTTLGIVSERTGGVVAGNTVQASRFAERVASDLSHWYSIGYPRPGGNEASGKIVVKAKKPGLVVRSRKAFVDRPPGEVMRERVVANLFRRDEAAKLPIGVEAGAPVAKEKGFWVTTLRVRVPVRSLAFLPDVEEAKGAVTLYRVSATPVGEVSDVREERQEVRVPAALATAESAVVLDYEVEVEAVDPASRLSVGVLDETSGAAGFRVIVPSRK